MNYLCAEMTNNGSVKVSTTQYRLKTKFHLLCHVTTRHDTTSTTYRQWRTQKVGAAGVAPYWLKSFVQNLPLSV